MMILKLSFCAERILSNLEAKKIILKRLVGTWIAGAWTRFHANKYVGSSPTIPARDLSALELLARNSYSRYEISTNRGVQVRHMVTWCRANEANSDSYREYISA